VCNCGSGRGSPAAEGKREKPRTRRPNCNDTVNIDDLQVKRLPLERVLGRLRPREIAFAVAILMACIGAAVGAASRPGSRYRFAAEAGIAVRPASGAAGLRRYAAAVALPQVVSGAHAATRSPHSDATIQDNTSVAVVAAVRMVLIRVRDSSNTAAVALANALAERAQEFVRTNLEGTRDGVRHVGDFERGDRDEWGLVRSAFNARPLQMRSSQDAARFGSGSLQVTCGGKRACGPSRRFYGSFHQGVEYSATAWVRSQSARSPVVLALGASGADVGVGRSRTLSTSWQRLVARWSPYADAGSAEVAVQSFGRHQVSFAVDGVNLTDPFAAAAGDEARPPSQLPAPPRLVAAVPVENPRGMPATAALLGAAAGLAAALGALALALLAQRRNAAAARGTTPPAIGTGPLLEEPKR
jgi:hypothetical protein